MNLVSRTLILGGLLLIGAGVIGHFFGKSLHLGRLPGDLVLERKNFKFYFPLASNLLASVILSLIFYLWRSR